MKSILITPFITALLLVFSSGSHARDDGPIKYATVKEALEDLQKQPGVKIRHHNGWTIISRHGDKEMVMWSFAPATDPAYPAVARRKVFESDAGMYVDLKVLCEASKPACDEFLEQFKQLNEQMVQGSLGETQQTPAQDAPWAADEKQKKAANALAFQYLQLLDAGRYQEAYALLAPGMQGRMSFMEWSRHSENFRLESGGNPVHQNAKVTWHKDPPNAAYPGVYAAFDLTCRYRNINICTETLILHQQATGEFRVMRHERNIVDKEAEKKLLEDSMKKNR